ncbi:hypothetical protein A4G99_16680 [Haladaptatus sp. R4]|nr:hypothetical protein A4G99_16680 [Haladaptatus sp. R4]
MTDSAEGDESFDLLIEAGTTTLWGLLDVEEFVLDTAHIYAERKKVKLLARNYNLLNDLRKEIPEESPNWNKITRGLVEASHAFAFDAGDEASYERTASNALSILDELKADLRSDLTGYDITAVGHAHIDLAWLWPWSETTRKGARSFSNVLKLMEEYPEFTFLQSQPHLYEFVRNRYPSIFERIESQIDTGTWQPTGALWVESDINLAGGEALARQYLLGKRYFRDKFDIDPQITFIPDVFGYSGSLPEIARAADCPYFFTQKLSWNNVNDIPYTSFKWEGIGGSSVLSHFPPADTYNGDMSVKQIRDSVLENDENDIVEETAYLFGWGDGGGGPTREMIENREIINEIGSLPDVSFGSLQGYFDRLSASTDDLPTWVGELYLEMHRGTLTTQARTKRNNRKGEFALREAELWSSLALAYDEGYEYQHTNLEQAWKRLLFNQFHDILPGSSVTEVYADAERDYERVFETTKSVTDDALRSLVTTAESSNLICVTNSLSWARDMVVEIDPEMLPDDLEENLVAISNDGVPLPIQRSESGSNALFVRTNEVPALGTTTIEIIEGEPAFENDPLTVSSSHIENAQLRVDLNDDGTITCYDKQASREILSKPGNRFVSYRDHPEAWDAWDIDQDVTAVGDELSPPVETDIIESGPVKATIRQKREFEESTLIQDISLERGEGRIDFQTDVDWHEEERLLKVHFPINVHTNTATYDIQFGHIERETHENTSWDEAVFEEPHQYWVDVSEHEYGVSVMNDCKYGVHVDDADIGLSLLRAPNSPDPEADRGHHQFQYSLYPHSGSLQEGSVVETGYEINVPSFIRPVKERTEHAPIEINGEGVVIESIKRAEDYDDALVIRLYEAWGRQTEATLEFDFPVQAASTMNLIEDEKSNLSLSNPGTVDLPFDPFDIKTILVKL